MTTTTVLKPLLWALLPIALVSCQSQPAEEAALAPDATAAGQPATAPATAAPPSAAAPATSATSPGTPAAPVERNPAALTTSAPLTSASNNNRPAPIEAPAPPPALDEVTVPAGTELSIELLNDLSSETATTETPVRGRLRRAIEVGGRTALPAGATLAGVVTDVVRPGRVKGRASLSVRFTNVTVDGERSAISTAPITVEGEGDVKSDATKIGVGAGVGAVVGGILGGGDGAAKGAAIGGAAGTGAVLATRGKDVVLASGTTLSTTLSAAKTVELPR